MAKGKGGAAVALLFVVTIGGIIAWSRPSKASEAGEPESDDERFLPPQFVKEANNERFFRAVAAPGAFGPHEAMHVLTFKRLVNGNAVFVSRPPDVPAPMIAAAIDAYGIQQVPPG